MLSKNSHLRSMALIACCSIFGCGGQANQSGTGSSEHPCPATTPANSFEVSALGGPVSGVQVMLVGPSQQTMGCQPEGSVTICHYSAILPGNYSVVITAPGFEPLILSATVTATNDPGRCCSCGVGTLEPSSATLTPANRSTVDVRQLFNTPVATCMPGYEHPNICCQGAPYEATVCAEDFVQPFAPCKDGQFTYPDPYTCCELGTSPGCAVPIGRTTDAVQQNTCTTPCAPGAYPDPSDRSLCHYGVEGVMSQKTPPPCFGFCSDPLPDYCTTSCPQGWAKAGWQNDLCCQTTAVGQTLCYSQAAAISGFSGGGGHSDGTNYFGEEFFDDGNSYVMTCNFTTATCNCLFNGVVVAAPSASQFDVNLLNLCPFPISH